MKKSDLLKLIKEEYKAILEAKMFDNPNDLLSGVDKYISDLPIKMAGWRKQLVDILEKDTGYQNMANMLTNFTEVVKRELATIENFKNDVSEHIREYNEIYSKSEQLSPEDEKMFDELESLDYKLTDVSNQMEEYIDGLEKITESYNTLSDTVRYIVKFDLKA
jgi:DNA repair exonuclease SbcCD ATPase subunit